MASCSFKKFRAFYFFNIVQKSSWNSSIFLLGAIIPKLSCFKLLRATAERWIHGGNIAAVTLFSSPKSGTSSNYPLSLYFYPPEESKSLSVHSLPKERENKLKPTPLLSFLLPWHWLLFFVEAKEEREELRFFAQPPFQDDLWGEQREWGREEIEKIPVKLLVPPCTLCDRGSWNGST